MHTAVLSSSLSSMRSHTSRTPTIDHNAFHRSSLHLRLQPHAVTGSSDGSGGDTDGEDHGAGLGSLGHGFFGALRITLLGKGRMSQAQDSGKINLTEGA